MFLTILALCALQGAAPVPPMAPPAPAQGEWIDIDGVVMVVNEDAITGRELVGRTRQHLAQNPNLSDEAKRRAQAEIPELMVREGLAVQAGRNMGFDEKLVARRVDDQIQRLIERFNGVVGLAKELERQGMTSEELRKMFEHQLYSRLWEEAVTGEGARAGARPDADTYIRPGLIVFRFQVAEASPEFLTALGGAPAKVRLQMLSLDPRDHGGPDECMKLAETLRARVQAGEDMTAIVGEFSASKENNGLLEVDEMRLPSIDARTAKFVAQATPGAISQPEIATIRNVTYIRMVRFVERIPRRVPPLVDATVQAKIRAEIEKSLRVARLERAYSELFRSAYVWQAEAQRPDAAK